MSGIPEQWTAELAEHDRIEDEKLEAEMIAYTPPEMCPYCDGTNLSEGVGYIGEMIVYCNDCGKGVWCEPVTLSKLA